ncbi:glucose / Sorbosone dehydrogenase family protein [Delftia acidovorans]|uniref:PQQ-dependent sugar dehydrogenase n=1 Tax=Delftia acidovorans TaxID=80866 RepID=UPI000507AC30|nr:PQQ-dependent sugar dehydrogenase [Delftia acidovorans]KFJ09848.1 glucose / Sorbosone dehydrogenase family protein [Delftia acidovorans]QQB52837.1 PQQ-dependent sugar dehydrogenase [Delftia acidovorans]
MPPSLSAAIGISTLGLSGALWAAGSPNLSTEIVAEGLEHPWAVAFLPDGRHLVTERPGRMRIVQGDGRLGAPLAGLPAVEAAGQGGLLDVVLDSDFARNRQLYFCYSEPGSGADSSKNSTALASARLSDDASRLEQVKVLFSQRPKYASALHFGCRIVERMVEGKSDGTLFLALGERSRYKEEAQNLKSHLGKIVRIAKDGSVPGDNPFAGRADARPEIWSYGHRNAQGAALGPDGSLWMHEHGPQGGDEVNRPEAGKNYGWPVITHGENYGGGKIGAGITRKEGMEQPQHYWVPSIAPSGMAFVTSDRYGPQWKGSLVVGSLKFQRLERLTVRSGKVTASEQVLPRLGQRVRDVRQGPDGWLYLLTDAQDGQLLRVTATP